MDSGNSSGRAKSSRSLRGNPPQEQQSPKRLDNQRAAQAHRITARVAERALLDAYAELGLDAEVRRFFRRPHSARKSDAPSAKGD